MRRDRHVPCLVAATVLLVAGCFGAREDLTSRPATVRVIGTVTYRGKPLPDAHVSLIPTGPEAGAFGKTDAEGKFSLQTFVPNDGAIPGDYTVTVTARTVTGGTNPSDDIAATPTPAVENWLAPQKYAYAGTSGLTATVKPDSENVLNLALTD